MRDADNDNEDTWQLLAAPTARVLGSNEKQNEGTADDSGGSDADKQKHSEHESYVNQRLRDLRAFEALYRGAMKRRR